MNSCWVDADLGQVTWVVLAGTCNGTDWALPIRFARVGTADVRRTSANGGLGSKCLTRAPIWTELALKQ